MRGWCSDLGLQRLRKAFFEKNPTCKPVQQSTSYNGEVEKSMKAHAFVDSDD
jgi:hypothetical protein